MYNKFFDVLVLFGKNLCDNFYFFIGVFATQPRRDVCSLKLVLSISDESIKFDGNSNCILALSAGFSNVLNRIYYFQFSRLRFITFAFFVKAPFQLVFIQVILNMTQSHEICSLTINYK